MKLTLKIVSAFLTITAFSFITYTSCKKDACKTVNCKNGGVCTDGACTCLFYNSGTNCETEVRSKYYNTYKGNATNSEGDTYTNWSLKFYKLSTDPTMMGLDVITDTNTVRASLNIQLQNVNEFVIVPKNNTSTSLTGHGTINANAATLTLIDSGAPLTIIFTDMAKQ